CGVTLQVLAAVVACPPETQARLMGARFFQSDAASEESQREWEHLFSLLTALDPYIDASVVLRYLAALALTPVLAQRPGLTPMVSSLIGADPTKLGQAMGGGVPSAAARASSRLSAAIHAHLVHAVCVAGSTPILHPEKAVSVVVVPSLPHIPAATRPGHVFCGLAVELARAVVIQATGAPESEPGRVVDLILGGSGILSHCTGVATSGGVLSESIMESLRAAQGANPSLSAVTDGGVSLVHSCGSCLTVPGTVLGGIAHMGADPLLAEALTSPLASQAALSFLERVKQGLLGVLQPAGQCQAPHIVLVTPEIPSDLGGALSTCSTFVSRTYLLMPRLEWLRNRDVTPEVVSLAGIIKHFSSLLPPAEQSVEEDATSRCVRILDTVLGRGPRLVLGGHALLPAGTMHTLGDLYTRRGDAVSCIGKHWKAYQARKQAAEVERERVAAESAERERLRAVQESARLAAEAEARQKAEAEAEAAEVDVEVEVSEGLAEVHPSSYQPGDSQIIGSLPSYAKDALVDARRAIDRAISVQAGGASTPASVESTSYKVALDDDDFFAEEEGKAAGGEGTEPSATKETDSSPASPSPSPGDAPVPISRRGSTVLSAKAVVYESDDFFGDASGSEGEAEREGPKDSEGAARTDTEAPSHWERDTEVRPSTPPSPSEGEMRESAVRIQQAWRQRQQGMESESEGDEYSLRTRERVRGRHSASAKMSHSMRDGRSAGHAVPQRERGPSRHLQTERVRDRPGYLGETIPMRPALPPPPSYPPETSHHTDPLTQSALSGPAYEGEAEGSGRDATMERLLMFPPETRSALLAVESLLTRAKGRRSLSRPAVPVRPRSASASTSGRRRTPTSGTSRTRRTKAPPSHSQIMSPPRRPRSRPISRGRGTTGGPSTPGDAETDRDRDAHSKGVFDRLYEEAPVREQRRRSLAKEYVREEMKDTRPGPRISRRSKELAAGLPSFEERQQRFLAQKTERIKAIEAEVVAEEGQGLTFQPEILDKSRKMRRGLETFATWKQRKEESREERRREVVESELAGVTFNPSIDSRSRVMASHTRKRERSGSAHRTRQTQASANERLYHMANDLEYRRQQRVEAAEMLTRVRCANPLGAQILDDNSVPDNVFARPLSLSRDALLTSSVGVPSSADVRLGRTGASLQRVLKYAPQEGGPVFERLSRARSPAQSRRQIRSLEKALMESCTPMMQDGEYPQYGEASPSARHGADRHAPQQRQRAHQPGAIPAARVDTLSEIERLIQSSIK
ncbi:Batten's disease protein Cln3, partial [Kipferlia bialata]